MKSQTRRIIEAYRTACRALLEEFVEMYWRDGEYFPIYNQDYFVIGAGTIIGVVCFGDYFIDWEEIEYCVTHQVPVDTFWAWIQFMEMMDNDPPINHKTFFTSYPNLPCTKVNHSTKKKSSTTKPSTGNKRRKDGKK